ncbi:hypothetical protein UP10_22005 [Bradyrhizobium sp. LTSPM299]|jgi:hypothetical protein|uniref:hypothetical protein n=1 Tax=Bradyrhizobium sp. LTSPM299 TaxID=1619233 RepID=UPI0005CB2D51|nr:hypothetical protein [Bradyrhizobium sp. LTSPM299]KJC58748.1 hypothetical protein UP10_22005 [Bradyrhizobium sp. LTSPM299]
MLKRIGRFVAAYVALALTMSAVAALWLSFGSLLAGALKPNQIAQILPVQLAITLTLISLRAFIAFACLWVIIHRYHYLSLWHFIIFGSICGLFVFMTMPDVEGSVWTFSWRDLSHLPPGSQHDFAWLVISGLVGGLAAGLVDGASRRSVIVRN